MSVWGMQIYGSRFSFALIGALLGEAGSDG